MKTYPIPMVPGPVKVPDEVLAAYQVDYGSGDLEGDFVSLYEQTAQKLAELMGTKNQVVIMTGEGMIALWGALKSCLLPGDRVLSVSTGLFGSGIGGLAESCGAEVRIIEHSFDETFSKWDEIEETIVSFKPKMITGVHCETPSGTLNPIAELGKLKIKHNVPLLYVDAVASIGGAPVMTDEWGVDLMLGGSQKALSVPPALAFLSVSDSAWGIIEEVDYAGYDALKPFSKAVETAYFPYTPYWHGVAALHAGVDLILAEGQETVYARHAEAAECCRRRVVDMGLKLFPVESAIQSPTVTAVKVPQGTTWEKLDAGFRDKGLVVGGNYGPLAGKVFRIGHMGAQANKKLVTRAMDAIEEVVRRS